MAERSLLDRMSDGPIPGENLTSDTRNYPWHRPPEHVDINDAIEDAINKLTERERVFTIVAAAAAGFTVSQITRTFLLTGIGAGKITPDFAILMAGPVARTIEIILKSTDTEYDMGLYDTVASIPTKAYIERLRNADTEPEEEDVAAAESTATAIADEVRGGGGFMNEQDVMLGRLEETV